MVCTYYPSYYFHIFVLTFPSGMDKFLNRLINHSSIHFISFTKLIKLLWDNIK